MLKKNNNLYFYINYYKLNKIIMKNYYFLLLITEIFNQLCSIKKFIKLDLKDIYYYIHIKKKINRKLYFKPAISILNILLYFSA